MTQELKKQQEIRRKEEAEERAREKERLKEEKIREYEIKMGMNQPEYHYKKKLEKLFRSREPVEILKPSGKGDKSIGYKHYIYRMVGFEWRAGSITKAAKGNGLVYSSYWMDQIKELVYHESDSFEFDPGYYKYLEIVPPSKIPLDEYRYLPREHSQTAHCILQMVAKQEEDFVLDEKLFEDIHLISRPRLMSGEGLEPHVCDVNYELGIEELLNNLNQTQVPENPDDVTEVQAAVVKPKTILVSDQALVDRHQSKFSIKITPPSASS